MGETDDEVGAFTSKIRTFALKKKGESVLWCFGMVVLCERQIYMYIPAGISPSEQWAGLVHHPMGRAVLRVFKASHYTPDGGGKVACAVVNAPGSVASGVESFLVVVSVGRSVYSAKAAAEVVVGTSPVVVVFKEADVATNTLVESVCRLDLIVVVASDVCNRVVDCIVVV